MNLTFEQKYHLLLEITRKIRDTIDLDEIMEHLLDTIQTVVAYDAAGIFVLNQNLVHQRRGSPINMITSMCVCGYAPLPIGTDQMLSRGKGIVGYIIRSGSSLVVPNVHKDERYIERREGTRSEIGVPIFRHDRAIGALNLESDKFGAYDETDLEVLQFFADAAAIALENAMLHQQILRKELLEKQLQFAKEVQTRLLPMSDPSIHGYDIAAICIPAEEIGGDYYDYLQINEGHLGLAVADVSGHGITSALAMTAFRGLLRMSSQVKIEPAGIAHKINHLIPQFVGDSHFITMTYGILNPDTGEMTFVRCGHPSPILLHQDGKTETLTSNGPAFGVYGQAEYINESKSLTPGDILVIYTDGVVEIEDPEGKVYSIERLMDFIFKHRDLPSRGLIGRIILETQAFTGYQTYLDDFTLMIVKKE